MKFLFSYRQTKAYFRETIILFIAFSALAIILKVLIHNKANKDLADFVQSTSLDLTLRLNDSDILAQNYKDLEGKYFFDLFDQELNPKNINSQSFVLPAELTKDDLQPGMNFFSGKGLSFFSDPVLIKRINIEDQPYYFIATSKAGFYKSLESYFQIGLAVVFLIAVFAMFRIYQLNRYKSGISLDAKESTPMSDPIKNLEFFGSSLHEGLMLIKEDFEILYVNDAAKQYLKIRTPKDKKLILDEHVRNTEINNLISTFFKSFERQRKLILMNFEKKKYYEFDCMPLTSFKNKDIGLISIWDATFYQNVSNAHRDFVANVSHELKTPITNIMGYAETLLNSPSLEKEKLDEMVSIIHDQSKSMQGIIETLLEISKFEDSKETKKLNLEKISLRTLLNSLVKMHQTNIEKKDLNVELDLEEDVEFVSSSELLFPALSNIIDNAIKFSEDNKKIVLHGKFLENSVSISVRDEGYGIPPKDIPYIFDKFYTGEYSRYASSKGAGLGLSIVKNCVSLLNGSINIKSDVNMGSEFTILLPMILDTEKNEAALT